MSPRTIASLAVLANSFNTRRYSALTQDEEKSEISNLTSGSSENGSSELESPTRSQKPATNLRSTFGKFLSGRGPWILSTILLFCTTLAMYTKNGGVYAHYGSFETGFNTDFSRPIQLSNILKEGVEPFKLLIASIRQNEVSYPPSERRFYRNDEVCRRWNTIYKPSTKFKSVCWPA